jgi:hypothetical protein
LDDGTTVPELLLAVDRLRGYRRRASERETLVAMLYDGWYARPFGSVALPASFPTDLVQVFRAADDTSNRWDGGWTAETVSPSGLVIARRGKEVRMAGRSDYLAVHRPGLLPVIGDGLELSGRRDRIDAEGAWWRTAGRSWRFSRAHPGLIRLYWNYELAYLPALIRRLTSLLAESDRPWMLKVAGRRETHVRADAAVLYLTRDAVGEMAPALDEISLDLSAHARPGAPPLALPVRPGLAVAVDPGENESFGQHRCRLIVEALHDGDLSDPSAAVGAILDHMRGVGIDADRPHAHRSDPRLPWEG